MPDYLGDEMRKVKKDEPEKEEKEIKCKWMVLFVVPTYINNLCIQIYLS